MRQLRQTQTSNQGQQTGICNGARVINRLGFAAKCKSYWLRLRATSEVVNRIPGGKQAENEQRNKWNTRCKGRVDKWQPFDGQRPQPVGNQGIKAIDLPKQLRCQPVGWVSGQFAHDTKTSNVFIFPRRPAKKTRQHISQAKQYQCQPGKAAYSRLGNDGWRRFVQNGAL